MRSYSCTNPSVVLIARFLMTGLVLTISLLLAASVDPLLLHPGPWATKSVIVHGEPDMDDLKDLGFRIRARLSSLFVLDPDSGSLTALSKLRTIRHIEASPFLFPLLDVATSDSTLLAGDSLQVFLGTGVDGTQAVAWTGNGCLVGVVDVGFDFDHPGFQDSTGSTRIIYLWDQTTSDNPAPPDYGYGSLWTRAEIDDGLCTQSAHFHGTRVLGIAAGNGEGSIDQKYQGVAFEAQILLVKTVGATDQIIDALAWIAETAEDIAEPVSINLSLGSHYGAHDGSRADEIALDLISGPGAVVSCAAGNSDSFPIHDQGLLPEFGSSDSLYLLMSDYPQSTTTKGFGVDFWYPGACSLLVTLTDPLGLGHGPVPMEDSLSIDAETGNIWIANSIDFPINGDHHTVLLVTDDGTADSVAAGTWTFSFETTSNSVRDETWHAWIFFRSHGACSLVDPDYGYTIIMPATADSCIAVGGYDRDTGTSYSYSSRGPTRDGRPKPELTAPTNVTTAEPGGGYALLGGTSAAAPHVAGAAALYLQRYPGSSPSHIRSLMKSVARVDWRVASERDVPNNKWGSGKLFVEPLLREFDLTEISVVSDTTFSLSWEFSAGAELYQVFRDSSAWFVPDTVGLGNMIVELSADSDIDPSSAGFQWIDPATGGALTGLPERLLSYVIRALKGNETWWSRGRVGAKGRDLSGR